MENGKLVVAGGLQHLYARDWELDGDVCTSDVL